jgi:hypothetical protein
VWTRSLIDSISNCVGSLWDRSLSVGISSCGERVWGRFLSGGKKKTYFLYVNLFPEKKKKNLRKRRKCVGLIPDRWDRQLCREGGTEPIVMMAPTVVEGVCGTYP